MGFLNYQRCHLGLPSVTKAPKVVATKVRNVNSGDQAILMTVLTLQNGKDEIPSRAATIISHLFGDSESHRFISVPATAKGYVIVPGTRVDWIKPSDPPNTPDQLGTSWAWLHLDQHGKIYGSMGVGLNQDTLSPPPTCRELHLDRCSVTDSWNNENAFQNIDHRKHLGECVFLNLISSPQIPRKSKS